MVTFDVTRDGIQVLLCAVQTPEPEIVIGGLPGREFMRQQPSGAATPNDVEDRMRDLAHRMQPWSANALRRRQQRIQPPKLSVREDRSGGAPGQNRRVPVSDSL